MIDPLLFPAPSWLLHVEVIDAKVVDHARRLVEDHREAVERQEHFALKTAYFQGVLDAISMIDAEGKKK